ncbi:MAG: NRDE family protein [Gammaproteobacteria bacterium]
MCLILIALQQHSRYPLVIAANRDEYFRRPAAPADFWADTPQLLAGRDLQAGGTWLGITRSGRFAAVTNVREPGRQRSDARSRGDLTTGFLTDTRDPQDYLAQLGAEADTYNGFNLICGTPNSLVPLFHTAPRRRSCPAAGGPAISGVSNHLLDTPWPKLVSGKQALGMW